MTLKKAKNSETTIGNHVANKGIEFINNLSPKGFKAIVIQNTIDKKNQAFQINFKLNFAKRNAIPVATRIRMNRGIKDVSGSNSGRSIFNGNSGVIR